ncbi:MAG: outer membrane protein assembly factor BamA [Calditrichia bacterium]
MKKSGIFWIAVLLLMAGGLAPLHAESDEKMEIKKVTFEGNHSFSDDRLRKLMVSRPSSFFRNSYYREEVLRQDLDGIVTFYNNQGYLQAEITGHEVQKDTSENEVRIHISLKEGAVTHLESISILGNEFYSDSLLRKKINLKPGDPLLRNEINSATVEMIRMYANKGFLDAVVKPDIKINDSTHLALVDYMIEENTQYTIDEIIIKGLDKTDRNVVTRELKFDSGDLVNYSELLQSQQNLYETGLFRSVYINPDTAANEDADTKDIIVEIEENLPAEFSISVGYATIEKLRGTLEIYHNNLMGTARKAGLQTQASFINRQIRASFTEPWTFGTRFKTDINAKWEYQEEPGYKVRRYGGNISVGREFLKNSNVALSYRIENVKLTDIKLQNIPRDLERNDLRTIKLDMVYDTRNDLFNATEGFFANLSNEVSGTFLSSTVSFFRSTLDLKYFWPLRKSTILASALTLGWMDAHNGLRDIPLNERFYTGGPNSVRGFNYQEVGSLDESGYPIGGKIKSVYNLEIRQTIYKMVGAVAFADVGNVWETPRYANPGDYRYAVGVGARVNTPIGLLRLDWGFNIFPQPDEPRNKLYFGMGQAF